MQGYLTILLIISHVLTLSLSDANEKIDKKSAVIEVKAADLNHRKLSIFPKNTRKFVVTPTPLIHVAYSHKPKENIMPKMALTPQVTLKPVEAFATTETTRKPLMKSRTYTIESRANGKFYKPQQDSQNNAHLIYKPETQIVTNRRTNPVTQRGDIVTEIQSFVKENKVGVKNSLRFSRNYGTQKNKQDDAPEKRKDKFLLEEQDRNEFIFIENDEQLVVDLLDNIDKEFDEVVETTTELIITQKSERVKRSNNIIEEENMASTVSGFKYTGHDTRLNNNFYFKNINA